MAELVDRQAIYKRACKGCTRAGDNIGECYESEPCARLSIALADAPAVDAVEVVRCMDCKYYRDWEDGDITCAFWTIQWDVSTEPDGFCRYGERRGENGR